MMMPELCTSVAALGLLTVVAHAPRRLHNDPLPTRQLSRRIIVKPQHCDQ